ncbi:hypothetical protein [Bacillus sp. CECT 9360]|uniref:hypothetical protein n=1 Tax=Bacillus sp. CECT 9360 TaxID=2845821 RepID=UPI0033A350C2
MFVSIVANGYSKWLLSMTGGQLSLLVVHIPPVSFEGSRLKSSNASNPSDKPPSSAKKHQIVFLLKISEDSFQHLVAKFQKPLMKEGSL